MNNILQNIYTSWYRCYNKNILVENYSNTIIIIDNTITIKQNNSTIILKDNIKKCNSVIISKCYNSTILVKNKINHITIEKSHDTNIIILDGLISGIDIITSYNNNIFVKNKNINYISCAKLRDCNLYLSKRLCVKTLINTLFCINIKIIITNNNLLQILKEYLTNTNYFVDLQYFVFTKNNDIIELHQLRRK
jgi:hypothetical protein